MSKINALIQELQIKQKKIDYLNYIKDILKNDQKCVDYVEVQDEVLSKVIPEIDRLSKEIEDGIETSKSVTLSTQLTTDQVTILSKLADKVQGKLESSSSVTAAPIVKTEPKKQVLSNQDAMSFALSWRHLANKKVKVHNDRGMDVQGTVVGLVAPCAIVKTTAGPTIEVPPEKLEQLS